MICTRVRILPAPPYLSSNTTSSKRRPLSIKKGKRETKLVAGARDRDGGITVVEVVGFLSRRRRRKNKKKVSRVCRRRQGKKIHGLTGEKEERSVAVLAG
jgi:hypothetical protein